MSFAKMVGAVVVGHFLAGAIALGAKKISAYAETKKA